LPETQKTQRPLLLLLRPSRLLGNRSFRETPTRPAVFLFFVILNAAKHPIRLRELTAPRRCAQRTDLIRRSYFLSIAFGGGVRGFFQSLCQGRGSAIRFSTGEYSTNGNTPSSSLSRYCAHSWLRFLASFPPAEHERVDFFDFRAANFRAELVAVRVERLSDPSGLELRGSLRRIPLSCIANGTRRTFARGAIQHREIGRRSARSHAAELSI